MKFLVINGPNLNLLGIREPLIYGDKDYTALISFIKDSAEDLGVSTELFQSNHEGAIVDRIQDAYGKFDAIVINPAAYTHTSIAILDALKAVSIPTVEVHLSDICSREPFRNVSVTGNAAIKIITGKGFSGYREAMLFLKEFLDKRSS